MPVARSVVAEARALELQPVVVIEQPLVPGLVRLVPGLVLEQVTSAGLEQVTSFAGLALTSAGLGRVAGAVAILYPASSVGVLGVVAFPVASWHFPPPYVAGWQPESPFLALFSVFVHRFRLVVASLLL